MNLEKESVTYLQKVTRDTGIPETELNTSVVTEEAPTMLQVIWETVRYALIAAMIIIPIRTFVAQPFVVSAVLLNLGPR